MVAAGIAACSSSGAGLFPYLQHGAGSDRSTTFAALDRALVVSIDRSQRPRAEAPPAPPIALTTSDGAGLVLARLELDAVVNGPLALTQLRMTFRNPEAREREGRFAITLPPDAAISRFAMKNDEWREAEVVTRQRARQVYETFLKRRVDPALLEKGAGNQFSARVFPIAPTSDKEIILTYSQEVSAATPYRVPLSGLPAIGDLRWSLTVDGRTETGELHGRAPGDLRADHAAASADQALVAGEAFVARLVPPAAARRDPLGDAVVLVDTSGSTASILRRQALAARAVVTAIAVRDPAAAIDVLVFDQAVEPVVHGAAGAIDVDAMAGAIVARGGLGASDLGQALAAADQRRLILISDGIATVGERAAAALVERVRAAGVARLDAVTVGGAQDHDLLAALTAAGARGGAIVDGDDPAALAALEQAMLGDVAVDVAGATDVWPTTLRGLGAGQPVVIYGRRAADRRAPLAIRFTTGGEVRAMTLEPSPGPAALVARAVARADVARLTAELATASTATQRDRLRAAIAQLGLAHRLVTGETSLLVLETDDDYARFCIDRRGLSGLLTIAGGAIEVIDRGADQAVKPGCQDELTRPPAPIAAPAAPVADGTFADEVEVITGGYNDPRDVTAAASDAPPIDGDHTRNVPAPGRVFEEALGTAAGSQGDTAGATFAGSSSVENEYYVDGINTGALGGETISISARAPTVDTTSTRQGLTISAATAGEVWNAPIGRLPSIEHHQPPPPPPPYEGRLLTVMQHLRDGRRAPALRDALAWYLAEPTELAAIVALGETLEAEGALGLAARAYGTILDRYPDRVELIRYAGQRLDRLGPAGRARALDAYRQAVADRPDHATGYRLLAMAEARTGDLDGALATLERGLARAASDGVRAILRGDLGLVGAALAARDPAGRAALAERLRRRGVTIPDAPSVRFVLHWETDTNDVDLHVRDRHGGHAFYSQRELASGGELLEDVTSGYGPEAFVIAGRPIAAPYRLSTLYFSRGAMGLGLGTVQVVAHDGTGGLTFEDRPFILQVDGAEVDLGSYAP